MAANYIEISTEQLDGDKRKITDELQGVMQELRQLQEEMRQLDAMWEGPAKQAFAVQFTADCETLAEICTNLSGYVESMQSAGNTYKRCEDQVAQLIAAIRI